jgi:thiol:disulfide interchange protein DsbD
MFARALFALSLLAGTAQAATIETEFVRGDFHFEHATVAPGKQTTLALDMTLSPGWHTYWKNAGDSGQPVEITWKAPDGVVIGDIDWPAPHRQPFAPMMNYGYEDKSTLLMPVTVPADWPVGEPVEMTADVFWLVCKEVCIPEQGVATVSLPTGPESAHAKDASQETKDLFMQARSAVPMTSPYEAVYAVDETSVKIRFAGDGFEQADLRDAYVFPAEWGVIDHAGIQVASVDAGGLTLTIPRSLENDEPPAGTLEGVFELTEGAGDGDVTIAMAFDAQPGEIAALAGPGVSGSGGSGIGFAAGGSTTFGWALGLAFLGGIILNLMPCVFPVLALKALSFVKMAQSSFGHRAAHGFAYAAGVVTLFVLLAAVFIGLREAGASIGWGFQLQNPYVVAGLAYLLFLVGLNLSGVFEVSSRLAGVGAEQAESGGLRGAFFTGALTAVVATPCTAPFMGTAMGATLTMPPVQAVAVFVALAVGLAAPFLLLSLSPAAARLMPKPGAWMVRLKEFLAFPMYATAALLVWVLGTLAGTDAMLAAMIGAVFIGVAAWAYGAAQTSGSRGKSWGFGAAAVSAVIALALITQIPAAPQNTQQAAAFEGPGEAFSAARLSELRAQNKPVFINMTADWCITCKVNEKVALRGAFEDALAENGVTYLKGDWTARDAEITALLKDFGRAGVPLYAVFPAQGEPVLLPQILTSDMLVDALGKV